MPPCSSLLVPTSDLEEEWRSESEEDHGDGGQIVSIQVEVEDTVRLVNLLVSQAGVRLLPDCSWPERTSRTTTVPIIFTSPGAARLGYGEKKAAADLAVSSQPAAARSLSPVVFAPPADRSVSPDRSAVKLKRQLTFVETSELCEAETQTESRELAAVESQTEGREEREGKEAGSQTDLVRDELQTATQTSPVAVSQAAAQTDPLPAQEELLADSFPPSRSPRYQLTFSSTQTSPPPSTTTMTSQTSPPVSSRTRESSPVAVTTGVSEAAADEMVARVLMEHAGAAGSSEEENSSRPCSLSSPASNSSSTISQADSGSLFSVESGRATSYDNVTNRQKDLSRTVNYLDLSRLGNEGETPNSDEIWVTVEDDNKFLTSDTETYSVATDKVSEHSVLSSTANCLKCKVGRISLTTANLLQINKVGIFYFTLTDREDRVPRS